MLKTCSILLGILAVTVSSQDLGCTLRGTPLDSTGTAIPNPKGDVACLDLASIEGRTITIPENVTRIDAKGLALCSTNAVQTVNLPPAIVFVLDQSTSMENTGGDPNGQRAIVVQNAIRHFYETSGNGWFSFIEFANEIEQPLLQSADPNNIYYLNSGADSLIAQDFIPLTQAAVDLWADSATSPIQRRARNGTNYVSPLRRAKEYINALRADTSKHVGQITVIFISDGQPYNPNGGDIDTILSVLDSNYEVPGVYVPIHGVFMGQNGTALEEIATATGGSYQAVDPADPNSLGDVLDSLVSAIALGGVPSSVILNSNGVDYVSRGMQADSTGGYQVQLNRAVPLDSGLNVIEMEVEYLLENGDVATRTVTFTLNVTDTPSDTSFFDAGGYFVGYCAESNGITVDGIGTNGFPNTINPDTTDQLIFDLNPTRFGDSSTVITITSVTTGDLETITIPAASDSAAIASFIGGIPIAITNGSHSSGDSILQVARIDTVYFRWVNPEDPRDTLSIRVLLGPTQSAFAANYNFALPESLSVGTRIQALSIKEPSALVRRLVGGLGPDGMTYTFIGGDTAWFRLLGDTLTLGAGLDYERDSVHLIQYMAETSTSRDTGTIRISVIDVNELPYGGTHVVIFDHALRPGDVVEWLNTPDPEGSSITMRVLTSPDGTFRLSGDTLYTDSDLAYQVGAVYRVPIEVSDGLITDTIFVEIHMVESVDPPNDSYIHQVSYDQGLITIESGPGLLQIHSMSGNRVHQQWLRGDGVHTVQLALEPGVYVITIGCAKRLLVVDG